MRAVTPNLEIVLHAVVDALSHLADNGFTPQGLYGLEKLVGEMIILQYKDTMDIKIAQFHNVYGPGGTWTGSQEKAPAAFARGMIILFKGRTSQVLHYTNTQL